MQIELPATCWDCAPISRKWAASLFERQEVCVSLHKHRYSATRLSLDHIRSGSAPGCERHPISAKRRGFGHPGPPDSDTAGVTSWRRIGSVLCEPAPDGCRRWSARWPRNRRRNRETTKASGAISAARNSRRTRSARSRPRAASGARRPRCRPPPRSRPCRGRHAAARIGLAEKRIHPLQHALRKRGPNIADAWDLTWVTALSINLWDLQSQERKKKHQPLQSRHSAGWRRTDKRRRRSTPMRKASRRDLDRRTHLLKSASNSNLP